MGRGMKKRKTTILLVSLLVIGQMLPAYVKAEEISVVQESTQVTGNEEEKGEETTSDIANEEIVPAKVEESGPGVSTSEENDTAQENKTSEESGTVEENTTSEESGTVEENKTSEESGTIDENAASEENNLVSKTEEINNDKAIQGGLIIGGNIYYLNVSAIGTGWSWDSNTGTLRIDKDYTGERININCNQTDSIKLSYNGDISIRSDNDSAIFCSGNLDIEGGEGILVVESTSSEPKPCAIEVYGVLSINSGEVHAISAGETSESMKAATILGKGIKISGNVNVTAISAGSNSSGIYSFGNEMGIEISTTGTVMATGTGTDAALMSEGGEIKVTDGNILLYGTPFSFSKRETKVEIQGGSVKVNDVPVYLTKLFISGFRKEDNDNSSYLSEIYFSQTEYKMTGVILNSENSTMLLLPEGEQTVVAKSISGISYKGIVNVISDNKAEGTLSKWIEITKIMLNQTSAEMKVGDISSLSATIAPADTTEKAVTWNSSDEAIATVDQNGKVTAKGVGSAVITVTSASNSSIFATCDVSVKKIEVTGITLNQTSIKLKAGNTFSLTASVVPVNAADRSLLWKTSDETIAVVDQMGKVTTKGIGSAVITVTSSSNPSILASCEITVSIGKVTGLTTTKNKATSITLKWEKQNKVDGYEIYRYDTKSKKYVKIADIKKDSEAIYTDKKRSTATGYQYKVRAYVKGNKKTEYGSYSSVLKTATASKSPTLNLTSGKKKAVLSWEKVNSINGYEIYMSEKKSSGYSKIKTVNSKATKYTKTKLTKGKTYYFKARTYKTVNGVKIYSSYSSVKKVKVKVK